MESSPRRKPLPKPSQPSVHMQIEGLQSKMKQAYNSLESTYIGSNESNEAYLLQIYMRILDKMLDDVVYAQEKVRLVDCDYLREEKCLNYAAQIKEYKQLCEQAKEKVKCAKESLARERAKTQKLSDEANELAIVSMRKEETLRTLKSELLTIENSKTVAQVAQLKQIQEQRPRNQCKQDLASTASNSEQKQYYNSVRGIKHQFGSTKYSLEPRQKQSTQGRHSEQEDIFSRPCATARTKLFNQKESGTLWLYHPSSYRNRKLMKNAQAKFTQD